MGVGRSEAGRSAKRSGDEGVWDWRVAAAVVSVAWAARHFESRADDTCSWKVGEGKMEQGSLPRFWCDPLDDVIGSAKSVPNAR